MKRAFAAAAFAASMMFAATPAAADDAVSQHLIETVMQHPEFQAQVGDSVRFYWGDAPTPAVARRIEQNATTSLRTRKLGRATGEACRWVAMSALIQLRDHATSMGGNAVVNIRSNWNNVEYSSRTEYQCAAGFLMAGVALKADVVSLR